MRVGIDNRLAYYRMGGIAQYTLQLIEALAEVPGQESFIIFHSRKDSRSHLPSDSTRFSLANLSTPCHHRFERWALAAELIPYRLDVHHSPDFIPPLGGAKRRIITVHDLTFLHYPEFLTPDSKRYYNEQIGWAVTEADHISADSNATREDLINLLGVPAGKVTTIYLAASAIHTAYYTEEEISSTLEEYHLPEGFILSVGTLEPRKNLPTLIHAYYHWRRDYRADLPLVIVGGRGWLYEEIFETIRSLKLSDDVHFLEGVNDVRLAHLYRAAGVLAFPSYYEGFGLPALEAMHAGCPVIASNRGSLVEVVGDAALLMDPDDTAGWTDAINRVLTDSGLANRLAKTGYLQAQKFTWAKTAEATLALYRGEWEH
jgi:glycosyltransferase involved in cell wall biosynthesis